MPRKTVLLSHFTALFPSLNFSLGKHGIGWLRSGQNMLKIIDFSGHPSFTTGSKFKNIVQPLKCFYIFIAQHILSSTKKKTIKF
ncbi:MAG: hypothetical protein AB7H48_07290 [Parachlamydiales bacterium]